MIRTTSDPFVYCDCGNMMDRGCNGEPRCDVCDPPCPYCNDGGLSIFDDDVELNLEETVDFEM